MKRLLFLAGAVLVAAAVLAPASAGAQDEKDGVVVLPPIVVEGVVKPKVMIVLRRAPFKHELPPLEYDSLAPVRHSVQHID